MQRTYTPYDGRYLIVGGLILLLLASALYRPAAVHATEMTVSITQDLVTTADLKCSLREAILEANDAGALGLAGECPQGSDTQTDTIILANGEVYALTIAGDDNSAAQGDLDIANNTAELDLIITTVNPDGDPAVISAGGNSGINDRVLQILSGANVRIENVIISGGYVALNGGGIFNNGTLELSSVTVSNNQVTDATFEGGGIYNLGSLILDSSSVETNRVTGVGGGEGGGGISNRGGTLTIQNSSSISDNIIDGNGNGAGLLNIGGTVNIANSAVETNWITVDGNGSGIFNRTEGEDIGLLTLNTVTIDNNTIDGTGSGVGLYNDSGSVSGEAVTISNNTAGNGDGGGIFNQGNTEGNGSLALTAASITSNSASGVGGGMRNQGGSVNLTDTSVRLNTAASGGGLYNDGFIGANGQMTLNNVVIETNTAGNGNGGGLFGNVLGSISLSNGSRISEGNSAQGAAPAGNGGGVYIGGGTLSVDNSSIFGNSAQQAGGGIYINATGAVTIENGSEIGRASLPNVAGSGSGGGIHNEGTLAVQNSVVQYNGTNPAGDTLEATGGGIHNAGSLELRSSTVTGNTTGDGTLGHGGGLYSATTSSNVVVNSTISGNRTGANAGGGGIYNVSTSFTLLFSTITNNETSTIGGGFFAVPNSSAVLRGNILAGNSANTNPNCAAQPGGMVSAGYNLVANNTGCSENFPIDVVTDLVGTADAPLDPLLGELADNGGLTPTHALLEGSPAIDTLTDIGPLEIEVCAALDNSPIAQDQRGIERPQRNTCDIGAFEAKPVRVYLPLINK